MSGGAGGPNVYHSNYDSFRFYEKFVDPEFQMGAMVEHIAGLMALRMANGDLIPYNLNRYASDLKMHISNAETKLVYITMILMASVKLRKQFNLLKRHQKS